MTHCQMITEHSAESLNLEPNSTPDGAIAMQILQWRRSSRADSTWRRYRSALRQFTKYCGAHRLDPLPATPNVVGAFLADYAAQHAWSSVQVARAAIGKSHRAAGVTDPTTSEVVQDVMAAIARQIGTAPHRQAQALARAQVELVLAQIPLGAGDQNCPEIPNLAAQRDRGLIAVWWLSACRSDEMAALAIGDVSWRPEGAVLHIRRSKTDQTGNGHDVPIPTGPATDALRCWLDTLTRYHVIAGPLWRRLDGTNEPLAPTAIVAILQRRAKSVGIYGITGHSIRSGHVTEAAARGVPLQVIAQQTGHKRLDTVAVYIRRANLFRETSAKGLL